jgi:hypothetical protein
MSEFHLDVHFSQQPIPKVMRPLFTDFHTPVQAYIILPQSKGNEETLSDPANPQESKEHDEENGEQTLRAEDKTLFVRAMRLLKLHAQVHNCHILILDPNYFQSINLKNMSSEELDNELDMRCNILMGSFLNPGNMSKNLVHANFDRV